MINSTFTTTVDTDHMQFTDLLKIDQQLWNDYKKFCLKYNLKADKQQEVQSLIRGQKMIRYLVID